MSYLLSRSGSPDQHRNLRAFCVIDSNGDALTYTKARHFRRKRSQKKTISLGSRIKEVVHGSEMFGLIADDGLSPFSRKTNRDGSSPPSPESDFAPIRFIAIERVSCASGLNAPRLIPGDTRRLLISVILSTFSTEIGCFFGVKSNKSLKFINKNLYIG